MSTLSLRLPDSLHNAAREEAKNDKVSINQLVATALAEKISALKTVDYLVLRAHRAPSRTRFEQLMAKVPDVKPERRDDRVVAGVAEERKKYGKKQGARKTRHLFSQSVRSAQAKRSLKSRLLIA